MNIEKPKIELVDNQGRFTWASEDEPTIVKPESLSIVYYQSNYLDVLSNIYMKVFNAQNKQLYNSSPEAILAWDEEPWTFETARKQVLSELESKNCYCLVALSDFEPVGFIIARMIEIQALTHICGSKEIAKQILKTSGCEKALIWEDAGVLNLVTPEGQKIKGVGTALYKAMAKIADNLGVVSIGRTAPGSNAEFVLPKVSFESTGIQDGMDKSRYWQIRKV